MRLNRHLFAVLVLVLLAMVSATQASFIISVELEYEVDALDLDTNTLSDLLEPVDPQEDVPWDVVVAYNPDRATHAVLTHNARNGTMVSFLNSTPFESVTHAHVADLTFTDEFVDQPLEGDDTVVVKTDTGAYFKIGHVTPTDRGVVFDYQKLENLFAQHRAEPEDSPVRAANSADEATPPAGLSRGDWRQIRALIREAEYRVTRREGEHPGFEARNAEHHLRMSFDERGVRVEPLGPREAAWQWELALRGYGYESAVQKAEKSRPLADGNRIEYRRGDLVEWYVNDEGGLEHGFTVAARPGENPHSGWLRFEMALSGSLEAHLEEEGSAIVFRDARGERVLRYAGLRVWDAGGRVLPARLMGSRQQLAILVDDRNADYPVTVDPTLTEDAKVTASDPAHRDQFGAAVAISGDTALVGARYDDEPGTDSGSAYVFTRSGTIWSRQAKLTAGDRTAWDRFGISVALSGDTALVGAPYDDDLGYDSGSAYVFTRSGTIWSQQAKLTASDGAAGDWFAISVALSGDSALIGASGDYHAGTTCGSAYVFTRDGTTWTEQAKLTATDPAHGDQFGAAVAISGDTAVVGARYDDEPEPNSGSAYVFTRSGTTWSEQAKLTASDGAAGDRFGRSVALSGDTAVVGAHYDDNAGSAYVFNRSGETWSPQVKLGASDARAWDCFGISVALSGDKALVGASGDDHGGHADCGSAYVFDVHNTLPVALCHDVTHECDGGCQGGVSPEDVDNGSYDPDGDPITLGLNPAGPYPLGDTSVVLTVTDDKGWTGTCAATVIVVDTVPPALTAPGDIIAECASPEGTPVDLGTPFTLDACGEVTVTNDAPPLFPLGTTSVTWTATDCSGLTGEEDQTVTVVDTTPPSLPVLVTPGALWPPNHRMIEVEATVPASDNCGAPLVTLLSVLSSEPDDAPGGGDGNTINDIQNVDPGTADYEFSLRAERSGSGGGRVYTVTYAATDESGNETTTPVMVVVDHKRGGLTDPIEVLTQETTAGTVLTWSLVDGASHYNVIRGDLADVVETASAIDLGPVACVEAHSPDETTEGWADLQTPAAGEAFFYLVEYDDGRRSSYGTESAPKPRVVQSGDCQ